MNKTNLKLDNYEKRMEKALERRDFVKAGHLNETKKLFEKAIENYRELQKSKRITIRVNNADLIKVKARAKRHNIPYQTLLNVLIRQFVEGRILLRF
jgi:predicted DNA binding CopG/RHH family protein